MQGRWVGPGCRQGRSFVRGVFVMLYVMCRIFCWLRCQKWNTNVQPNNDGIIVVRPLGCRSPLIGICMVANAIADPISFARRKKTPKPEVSKTNEIAMPTKNHSQQRKATYLPQRILQVMTLRLEYLQLGQLFRFLQHHGEGTGTAGRRHHREGRRRTKGRRWGGRDGQERNCAELHGVVTASDTRVEPADNSCSWPFIQR